MCQEHPSTPASDYLEGKRFICMFIISSTLNPNRAPLKEVLGGQYNYREWGTKCCGRALKAAGGVEIVSVVRIRAPTK